MKLSKDEQTHLHTERANRLIKETSPYLLQHAHNPVDWYPWGSEALDKAKTEDKPILLSVGYSACHWCHVMEHESFENSEIAQLMNEYFVPIKVDREERPDIDEIYMKAVQLMTGHGGWPMTVFLTPELKPFYGGTYYPAEDRDGMPGFKRLLLVLAEAWQENRDKLNQSSDELTQYINALSAVEPSESALDYAVIDQSMERLFQLFDHSWGGFGAAPKFPQTYLLSLAMRYALRTNSTDDRQRQIALEIVTTTLDRMAFGGIHDQIGGGFARYSVDRYWRVPHFEKMLYDNATLSKIYLDGYLLTGRAYWKDVARATLDFVERELRTADGAFFSSLDADSEGHEGKFYVWQPSEIVELLGESDGNWFNQVFGVTDAGSFEKGHSVLMLSSSPEALAEKYKITTDELWARLNPLKTKLLEAREKRVHPGRDEKVLTNWNSLMISSYVSGYVVLQEDSYLKTARDAANFILTRLIKDGKLLHTWGQGQSKLNAYLDDYAYLIQALLDLASVDFSPSWLEKAVDLADSMIEHFWDEDNLGFFYTSNYHEKLISRLKNFYDGTTPSGTSVATHCLLRLAQLTGNQSYRLKAEQVFKLYAAHGQKAPDQFANLLCALDRYFSTQTEIALVADTRKDNWRESLYSIHSYYLPNTNILLKDISCEMGRASGGKFQFNNSPLIADRQLLENQPTVYICKNYTCNKPTNTASALSEQLKDLSRQA